MTNETGSGNTAISLAVGTAVFVGGVQADIPLPYSKIMLEELNIRGSFMYPRHVPGELYRMIAAGIVDLTPIQTHTFSLDNVNEAFALG
ncbi:hypothetical protein H6F61_21945 [Cyanobacteria bacterium FACHB-472]|nr:hypothetical protein [Cyanobacteria bacterium FACHB-472]